MIAPLTLAVATIVCAAQSSQPSPRQPNTQKRSGATADQQSAQPPINVTVTTPQKSANELEAERKDRAQEIAIQTRIGQFTFWLVVVGFLQVLAIGFGLAYTARAANAAKRSADTAAETQRLALTPVVEIAPTSEEGMGFRPVSTSRQRFTYTLRLRLLNVGPSPARVLRIEWRYLIANEPDIAVESQEGFTLGPARSRETDVLIEISEATRKIMNEDGLMIRLHVMLKLNHPITGPFWHTYELTLYQLDAHPTAMEDQRDYDGRPENQGQSEDEP